ncbi:MAG TPA: hypothetical protein VGL78_10580 [Solirubrobacteraceae bacterium]
MLASIGHGPAPWAIAALWRVLKLVPFIIFEVQRLCFPGPEGEAWRDAHGGREPPIGAMRYLKAFRNQSTSE